MQIALLGKTCCANQIAVCDTLRSNGIVIFVIQILIYQDAFNIKWRSGINFRKCFIKYKK